MKTQLSTILSVCMALLSVIWTPVANADSGLSQLDWSYENSCKGEGPKSLNDFLGWFAEPQEIGRRSLYNRIQGKMTLKGPDGREFTVHFAGSTHEWIKSVPTIEEMSFLKIASDEFCLSCPTYFESGDNEKSHNSYKAVLGQAFEETDIKKTNSRSELKLMQEHLIDHGRITVNGDLFYAPQWQSDIISRLGKDWYYDWLCIVPLYNLKKPGKLTRRELANEWRSIMRAGSVNYNPDEFIPKLDQCHNYISKTSRAFALGHLFHKIVPGNNKNFTAQNPRDDFMAANLWNNSSADKNAIAHTGHILRIINLLKGCVVDFSASKEVAEVSLSEFTEIHRKRQEREANAASN